jgi:hypothetical protein
LKQNIAGTGFNTLISGGTICADCAQTISLNVSPDGSKYAVAVDGAGDNASVQIFYDE